MFTFVVESLWIRRVADAIYKAMFPRDVVKSFPHEASVENSKRFPRDLVKRFQNILKQI